MVKIREYFSEEDESTCSDTAEEDEDDLDEDGGIRQGLPDPLDPHQAPGAASSPEQTAREAAGPSPSEEPGHCQSRLSRGTGVMSSLVRIGLSRHYIWYLLSQYRHSSRALQAGTHGSVIVSGLHKWASELQQLVRTPNGHGEASTSDSEEENQGQQNPRASVTVTESSSQTTREIIDDEDKVESDDSAGEKSNGMSEKQQVAAISAVAKAELLPSPDMSEHEISDVTDSSVSPDNEALHVDSNQDFPPIALKDCPWTKDDQDSSARVQPEDTESGEEKESSEASDEGEAAALPATAVVKDCWEEWVTDDRLFALSDAPAPSTSAAHASPTSPTTENHRIRLENRQSFRQNTSGPISRYIFVPTEKIGRIVGKGGKRVKEIEAKTGAKIKVENKKSSEPVTQITLTGTDAEISKADEEICIINRNFKPPKSGESTTASVSSQEEMELKRLLVGIKNQLLDGEKRSRKRDN